jgi:hypothetical protein
VSVTTLDIRSTPPKSRPVSSLSSPELYHMESAYKLSVLGDFADWSYLQSHAERKKITDLVWLSFHKLKKYRPKNLKMILDGKRDIVFIECHPK